MQDCCGRIKGRPRPVRPPLWLPLPPATAAILPVRVWLVTPPHPSTNLRTSLVKSQLGSQTSEACYRPCALPSNSCENRLENPSVCPKRVFVPTHNLSPSPQNWPYETTASSIRVFLIENGKQPSLAMSRALLASSQVRCFSSLRTAHSCIVTRNLAPFVCFQHL